MRGVSPRKRARHQRFDAELGALHALTPSGERLDIPTIASALSTTPQTIYSIERRALSKLRALLRNRNGSDSNNTRVTGLPTANCYP